MKMGNWGNCSCLVKIMSHKDGEHWVLPVFLYQGFTKIHTVSKDLYFLTVLFTSWSENFTLQKQCFPSGRMFPVKLSNGDKK